MRFQLPIGTNNELDDSDTLVVLKSQICTLELPHTKSLIGFRQKRVSHSKNTLKQ